ncbi:Hemerythrin HHE cation binding domain protein [uncultured archaeon]|nr:Hemerythrin HHE cation binding domain protein [uncultured archaeon]
MAEKISTLMLKEHRKIDNLLSDFGKELPKDFDEAKIRFSEFVWALQKHFFLEEKAIFIMGDKLVGEEVVNVFELMKEHGEITELVKNIEEGINTGVNVDISSLRTLILKHAAFEDKYFYPELDESLDPEVKEQIINRIKQLI